MASRTQIRARLGVSAAALLVGVAASACGGSDGAGAPTDASSKEFCATQSQLFKDLMPTDLTNPQMPSNQDMAKAVKGWASDLEKVGTPKDISSDARAGFEALVKQAGDINPADFSINKLQQLAQGGADATKATTKEANAFADYLTKTCGNPLENLKLPEMPGSS